MVKTYAENLGSNVTLEMVAIPGGEFLMGTSANQSKTIFKEYLKTATQESAEKWISCELPQHKVVIPAFRMGKYPVTQKQWLAVMGEFKLEPGFAGKNRPIERVSWDDAMVFCAQLSQKTGKLYRLPTEAEWEYACRAGTITPFSFGETITPNLANYNSNYTYGERQGAWELLLQTLWSKGAYREQTTDVDSFPANRFGLSDMHGNIAEWCADQWYGDYAEKPEPLKQNGAIAWTEENTKISPKPHKAEFRLLRGGSWDIYPWFCRSAHRCSFWHDFRGNYIGFRLVCAVPRTL